MRRITADPVRSRAAKSVSAASYGGDRSGGVASGYRRGAVTEDAAAESALSAAAWQDRISLATLCRDCVDLLPVDGAAIALMGDDASAVASAACHGLGGTSLDLELTVGEGPGWLAFARGEEVLVPDLRASDGQWPQYTRGAAVGGICAVYAFPLQIGAARLGVLTLYRRRPGALTDTELSMSLSVADALTQVLLGLQIESDSDALAQVLEAGAAFRAVVHQATGAVADQLGCSVAEALVRLRAAAFASGHTLSEVATDVIAGTVRIGAS
jgi:hypothetical protein